MHRKKDTKTDKAAKRKYAAPELKKYTFLKKEFLKFEGMAYV